MESRRAGEELCWLAAAAVGWAVSGQGVPKQRKSVSHYARVSLYGMVVTADFSDGIYIESRDRLSGIRVENRHAPVGKVVTVDGVMATSTTSTYGVGERVIGNPYVIIVGNDTVSPLGMPAKSIGGGHDRWIPEQPLAGQQGIDGAVGLNNIGVLVRTWGKVTYVGSDFLYIDDGSGLYDTSYTPTLGNTGIRIRLNYSNCKVGDYIQATGISSTYSSGDGRLYRLIRPRNADDMVVLRMVN